MVSADHHNGNILFYGYNQNNIRFDSKTKTWNLTDSETRTTVAYYKPNSDLQFYPVGKRLWNFMDDQSIYLKLTKVSMHIVHTSIM